MYDKETGEVWTDEFYSIGHNEWKVYHANTVVDLGELMGENNLSVTMANVRKFVEENF